MFLFCSQQTNGKANYVQQIIIEALGEIFYKGARNKIGSARREIESGNKLIYVPREK